jgi:hypothetical protein
LVYLEWDAASLGKHVPALSRQRYSSHLEVLKCANLRVCVRAHLWARLNNADLYLDITPFPFLINCQIPAPYNPADFNVIINFMNVTLNKCGGVIYFLLALEESPSREANSSSASQ